MTEVSMSLGPKGVLAKIKASAPPLVLVFLPGCLGAFIAFALGHGAPITPPPILDSLPVKIALQILMGGIAAFAFVFVFCSVSPDSLPRLIGISLIAGYGWNAVVEKFDAYVQTQEANQLLTEKVDVLENKTEEILLRQSAAMSSNPTGPTSLQFLSDFAEVRPFLTNPGDPLAPSVLDDQAAKILEELNSGAGIGGGAVTLPPETTFKLQSLRPWVPAPTWNEIERLPGIAPTQ